MKNIARLFGVAGMVLTGTVLLATQSFESTERVQIRQRHVKKHVKKHVKGAASVRNAAKQEKSSLFDVWTSSSSKFAYVIKTVGSKGKTLTTTDETIWEISSNDASKLVNWAPNSTVVIMPNYTWFSSYDYVLHNKWTNESVRANLSQGPFVKYALFIQQIDTQQGVVRLSNDTLWNVSVSNTFRNWRPGQAVLIGENDSWFGKPNILININENNFVTVSPR